MNEKYYITPSNSYREFLAKEEAERAEQLKNWNADMIAEALNKESGNQDYPKNIAFVIHQIEDCFRTALSAADLDSLLTARKSIQMHESYLGEKMRDSQRQKDYMKVVALAIDYLEEKATNPASGL